MGRFRPDREGIVSPGPSAMFLRGNSALVEEMARTDSKILSLGLPEHRTRRVGAICCMHARAHAGQVPWKTPAGVRKVGNT